MSTFKLYLGILATLLMSTVYSEVKQEPIHPIHIVSQEQSPQLIELYTSQGCSSCPSAEAWLNKYKDNPELWQNVVPVAFHVDYWDYLGWKDTFSKSQFSTRQREHYLLGSTSAVYTPGFVINGREWQGFFSNAKLSKYHGNTGGMLILKGDTKNLTLVYSPNGSSNYIGNLVLLGFDIKEKITAGENNRRTLEHDFTALYLGSVAMQIKAGKLSAEFELPRNPHPAPRYGLAAWVTPTSNRQPLQALGGWIASEQVVATGWGK